MIPVPEFSKDNLRVASYAVCGVVSIAGFFLIFQIIFNSGWTIKPEWNMFKSWLLGPLYVIGLIVALKFFGKTHYSQDTYIETHFLNGDVTRTKSNDIIDWLIGHLLIPVFGHFVLEPLIVAAAIYYPLMLLIALMGAVLPYVLSVLIIAVCVVFFFYYKYAQFTGASIVLIVAGILFAGIFTLGGLHIYNETKPVIEDVGGGGGDDEDGGFPNDSTDTNEAGGETESGEDIFNEDEFANGESPASGTDDSEDEFL